jgi:hypothetical protein
MSERERDSVRRSVLPPGDGARRAAPRILLAVLLAATASPTAAATVRATFLFIDESGQTQQETLSDVRYGFMVRRFLNVRTPRPAEGQPGAALPHKDKPYRRRSLLLQDGRYPLYLVRSIELGFRPSDTAGVEALVLRVTLVSGLEIDVKGSELRGFETFSPPFFEGKRGEEVLRFMLPAFRRQGESAPGPALQKILVHGRPPAGRRAPPKPRP